MLLPLGESELKIKMVAFRGCGENEVSL